MKRKMKKLNLAIQAAVLSAGLLVANGANALVFIENFKLDFSGIGIGGGTLTDLENLQGNGSGVVVQESSGTTPLDGDRFYEAGFINYTDANNQNVFPPATSLSTIFPAGYQSLYIVFELGGYLDIPGTQGVLTVPDYLFDFGRASLILDENSTPNTDDGLSLTSIVSEIDSSLASGTFVMPGTPATPGGDTPATYRPGTPSLDVGGFIVLASLEFLLGGGGDVPNGFTIPGSQNNATFGVDLSFGATCTTGVFFTSGGTDFCDGANASQLLARTFFSVTGDVDGNQAPTIYAATVGNTGSGGVNTTMIRNITSIGDTALPATIPEPTSLALLGIGLLGFSGATWKRRRA